MNAVSRNGNIFENVAIKAPVRLATTGNIVLNGLQPIDGEMTIDGDRVLVKDQNDGTQDGIWQASDGPWIRTRDAADNNDFVEGTLVFVCLGTSNAGTGWQVSCADSPIIIGTSELAFIEQSELKTATQRATSVTSNAIGTGAKSFAIEEGKDFGINDWLLIYETSAPSNAMLGKITSYVGTALAVSVVSAGGSGTHVDWTLVLANSAAAAGKMPPLGTGNVAGPGSAVNNHFAAFDGTTGQLLKDSGTPVGALAGRDTIQFGDAAAASIPQSALSPGAAPLPCVGPQPADNLQLQNDLTNATRDVAVTTGRARNDTDTVNLRLSGAMVKRLDAAWAAGGFAGSPAGGCDSGTKGASQTWHLFLIGKLTMPISAIARSSNVAYLTVTGHGLGIGGTVRVQGVGGGFDADAVITAIDPNTIAYANTGADVGAVSAASAAIAHGFDVLASQSYSAPTMPSGWTVKQCLGSVLTDGSGNVRAFTQIGDYFRHKQPVLDINNPTLLSTAANFALTVPLGVSVEADLNAHTETNNVYYFRHPGDTDVVGAAVTSPGPSFGSTVSKASGPARAWTNTSAQVGVRGNASGGQLYVNTVGYRDPRRRLF